MAPRTKSRDKSDLRKNERMVREMTAWLNANVSSKVRAGATAPDATLLAMVKSAFVAGWRSKNLKEHEPALGMTERDLVDAMCCGAGR